MKNYVVLKSYPNGISIYLDPDVEFNVLAEEIQKKFKEAERFFKDARLAVSFDGRQLSDDEERILVNAIYDSSGLNIACLIGKNEETDKTYIRALKQLKSKGSENSAQLIKGNLTDGQCIESESTVVVLGDVYPGCKVSSKSDIIIIGGLFGEACAGIDSINENFVFSLELSPENLEIHGLKYKSDKPSKWSIKQKIAPQIVIEEHNRLVAKPVTKDLLNSLS